jgi:hypothetical protein
VRSEIVNLGGGKGEQHRDANDARCNTQKCDQRIEAG